ncbi:MAG: hypothetical protein LBH98_08330 [Chitinispirillales bacterium]|jgi:serine kinase of HPr protein (carbohydrate metabolism regulator)|nr:hypothetical protein [Chitinispirillales bacterium]
MKTSDVSKILFIKAANDVFDGEVNAAYTSDLLSDVLANAESESVLITIQAHKNTTAVAGIVGANTIIICNSREIPQDMISAANDSKITLFVSEKNQFETSVAIAKLLGTH